MTLVCITNEVRGMHPCTVRGAHTVFCDRFERRWVTDESRSQLDPDRRWELQVVDQSGKTWPTTVALADARAAQELLAEAIRRERSEAAAKKIARLEVSLSRQLRIAEDRAAALTPRSCAGCLPRKAEHGLLCWSCWEKARDALGLAVDMVTHLASIERAQQVDNAGVRGGQTWVIPVPMTWRMADDLLKLLGHPEPGLPTDASVWEVEAIAERHVDAIDPETWVASLAGAEAAVRFYLAIQHAMRQHPMEEYEHRIRNVRCPHCRRRTLLWKPPLAFARPFGPLMPGVNRADGTIRVVCTNPDCTREMDQDAYEKVADIEENIRRQARQREDAAPAEPVQEVAS